MVKIDEWLASNLIFNKIEVKDEGKMVALGSTSHPKTE